MATYQDSRYNIALPSGSGGALVPIKTLTASSSATLSFLNGADSVVLDDTYKTYIFKFYNIHPATDGALFSFQADTGTNTSYNTTITSNFFTSIGSEDGTEGSLGYQTGDDLAQSTSFQRLMDVGNGNDESGCGELMLFSPSSSTFVKHFMSRVQMYENGNRTMDKYIAGYFNTTTALTRVQFKFSSGNIDAGTIKLFGIA
jgi:hypothetical protein|tara:strand:- start:193 stop:795 length:603 start_codon:yes stop_codon:yes gene_type:complete